MMMTMIYPMDPFPMILSDHNKNISLDFKVTGLL